MAGPADPLQESGDRTGRADLHDQVDVADVDAQLERRRRHDRLEFARFQLSLRLQPLDRRRASRGGCLDVSLAQLFGQLVREPLGQPPRVDEDQRRAVLLDQLDEPFVNLGPLLVHADAPSSVRGSSIARSSVARVADVDDIAGESRAAAAGRVASADEKAGRPLDRFLRRRQADPLQRAGRTRDSSRSSVERQMRAALVADHRVDFVDDHGVDVAERLPALGGREHQIQRFGRRHQNMRRPADEGRAVATPACRPSAAPREY